MSSDWLDEKLNFSGRPALGVVSLPDNFVDRFRAILAAAFGVSLAGSGCAHLPDVIWSRMFVLLLSSPRAGALRSGLSASCSVTTARLNSQIMGALFEIGALAGRLSHVFITLKAGFWRRLSACLELDEISEGRELELNLMRLSFMESMIHKEIGIRRLLLEACYLAVIFLFKFMDVIKLKWTSPQLLMFFKGH